MLRCLENAVAAGHIAREKAEEAQREIDRLIRQSVAPEQVRERLTKEMEAQAREAKRRALLQEARRLVLTEQVMNHRNARGELDPAEALWLTIENFGQARGIDDAETRKWVILRQVHQNMAQFLNEFHKGALTGDLRRREPHLVARMDNIVRELFGEASNDPRAKALADAWTRTAEGLRVRGNAAGMAIGKLDKWGLPQSHSPEALLTIGEEAWVRYLMRDGVLDRAKMISQATGKALDDAELEKGLREAWKNITTDGWIERDPSYAAFGRGALAKRRDEHHRFIHFKSADAWLAYHREFKAGDPFEAMMSHLSVMARDIATLEIFGPNPETMRNYLKQLVLRHAADAVPQRTVMLEKRAGALSTIEKVLPGETGRDLVGRIEKVMEEMADASRRAIASDSDEWRAKAREAAGRMDAIERELERLEPLTVGERRARLETEIAALDAEAAGRKAEGGGKRAARRNEGRLREVERRRAVLDAELKRLEGSDTSVMGQAPDVYQEAIDAFAALKQEIRAMRSGAYYFVKDPKEKAKAAIYRAEKMWDIFRGNNYAPVSSTWANVFQTARNWMTSVLLGSSSLSTLADIANIRQARWMAGMDPSTLKILGGYLDQLKFDRVAAMEAGLLLDSSVHVMHQQARYLGSVGFMSQSSGSLGQKAVQWSGFLSDRTITLSGMAWMTQAAKWAFGTAIQVEMGKLRASAFDDLPDMMRRAFDRHQISAADWDAMRKAELYSPTKGLSYLRPQEVAKLDRAVAEKYLAMIHRETRFAVVEGTVKSRSYFGGERSGTLWGEWQRNSGQLKSFGVAMIIQNIGRIVREAQAGNIKNAVGMSAGLAISGAIIGALVNEITQIVSGKDPRLPSAIASGEVSKVSFQTDYWGKAILKSGGLGIYGDILFGPVSRSGMGLASTALGPVGQQIDKLRTRSFGDTLDWWEGKPKDGKLARDAIGTARELLPGSTLWYLRLVKERWGLNQLALQFDPRAQEVMRRHEQLQRRVDGNGFWWSAGQALPSRPPMLWPDRQVAASLPSAKPSRRRPEPEPKPVPADAAAAQFPVGSKLDISAQRRPLVVDGDTVQLGGQRWRLEGYDAPEVFGRAQGQGERTAGVRAAVRLGEMLRDGRIEMEVIAPPDKWGRGRARLTIDGRDVAQAMRREGHVKRVAK